MTMVFPSYLPELKRVLNDKEYKKQRARVLLQRVYRLDGDIFVRHTAKDCGGCSSWSDCIFGSFCSNWDKYYERKYPHTKEPRVCVRNGVEILGLEPLGTGHTFSNKCKLTITELKEKCKMNGIKVKSTWKKQELLHALMKV